jgi:haloacetate dehalogenase
VPTIDDLLTGFPLRKVRVDTGVELAYRAGGAGPPLLLLHGAPQTHVMWALVAPRLARRFTVVMSDLRGYGDSAKPPTDARHEPYGFRAMAADQVALMAALGHDTFMVAGHDRGGRTAHRMGLDRPERVIRAAVLDIAPTLAMYEQTDMAFATAYYHWFFLIQPAPMPERLIGADPLFYLRNKLVGWTGDGPVPSGVFHPACLAEYERCNSDPAAIHGLCEDYRAAATIDLEHDRADRAAGRRIRCPLLVLWGERNPVWRGHDPLATWREAAQGPVSGRALPGGHYLAEERPDETAAELERFFSAT